MSECVRKGGREGACTLTEYQTSNHQVEICFWYAVLLRGKEGVGEGRKKGGRGVRESIEGRRDGGTCTCMKKEERNGKDICRAPAGALQISR